MGTAPVSEQEHSARMNDLQNLIRSIRQQASDCPDGDCENHKDFLESEIFQQILEKAIADQKRNVDSAPGELSDHNSDTIRLLYQLALNRDINEHEFRKQIDTYTNCEDLLTRLVQSEEFRIKNLIDDKNRASFVRMMFNCILERNISDSELTERLANWKPPGDLVLELLHSEEYRVKYNASRCDLSRYLGEHKYLLNQDKPISVDEFVSWHQTVIKAMASRPAVVAENRSAKKIADEPKLVLLTSLYKGERYIRSFLDAITSQTRFEECLLYIVDANSPEEEYKTILEYQEVWPNIRYERIETTIGIYEAWNRAINNTDSPYLSNANVDDLHSADAIEMKISALEQNPDADVAYSDVYYSFLPNVPFDVFSQCDIRTYLPIADKTNLLEMNSPHNAPIWRRRLHAEIGLFDSSFKSAGDHEFWLRAASAGKKFFKIDKPVTGYFLNVDGMSTRNRSPGVNEGQRILKTYSRK